MAFLTEQMLKDAAMRACIEFDLVDGFIPANTECPYMYIEKFCNGNCIAGHQGRNHEVPFSCAMARAWEISCKAKRGK